jgi:hypothetical protein
MKEWLDTPKQFRYIALTLHIGDDKMVIYSVEPRKGFVASIGDRVVYGEDENNLRGVGSVTVNEKGRLVVNGTSLETLTRKWNYLRLLS